MGAPSTHPAMIAAVVAHGEVAPDDRGLAADADMLIAADGGALHCARWGLRPHLVIGDLDSLGATVAADLGAAGTAVIAHPTAKDQTDMELAVFRALAAGAREVVLLGALGGARLDHHLANTLLLADPRLRGRVRCVRGGTTLRALHGGDSLSLNGPPGTVVSLLPIGDAGGVTTSGLRYPLRDEPLPAGAARGISNVIERTGASVSLGTGVLVVIEIADGGVT